MTGCVWGCGGHGGSGAVAGGVPNTLELGRIYSLLKMKGLAMSGDSKPFKFYNVLGSFKKLHSRDIRLKKSEAKADTSVFKIPPGWGMTGVQRLCEHRAGTLD